MENQKLRKEIYDKNFDYVINPTDIDDLFE